MSLRSLDGDQEESKLGFKGEEIYNKQIDSIRQKYENADEVIIDTTKRNCTKLEVS